MADADGDLVAHTSGVPTRRRGLDDRGVLVIVPEGADGHAAARVLRKLADWVEGLPE